jgi:uncharacterized protein YjcR
MANQKNKELRLAEQLYVYDDMSQKEIAEYLNVSEKTISNWKEKGDWDKMKSARSLTRDSIIKGLYENALLITNTAKEAKRPLNSKEMDAIVKIASSIEKLDKKFNIPVVIGVFKEFNNWVVNIDPNMAIKLTEYQRKFIYHLNSNE